MEIYEKKIPKTSIADVYFEQNQFLNLLFIVRLNFLVAVCIIMKERKRSASSIYPPKNSKIQISKKNERCEKFWHQTIIIFFSILLSVL